MPATLALTPVEAPPLRPPTAGLLTVASGLGLLVEHAVARVASNGIEGEEHWLGGIRWQPALAGGLDKEDICGTADLPGGSTQAPPGEYFPFALYARDQGSSLCVASDERARASLLAKESGEVEEELELAALIPANRHLAMDDASTTILPSGTVATAPLRSPAVALALLERAIANSRLGMGLIHVPAVVAPRLPGITVDATTGIRYTPSGNPLVIGQGYVGAAPDGTVPTDFSAWMYATDLMVVHRSAEITTMPETRSAALDRHNNIVAIRAYRSYAIAWSRLLHAAVHVEAAA